MQWAITCKSNSAEFNSVNNAEELVRPTANSLSDIATCSVMGREIETESEFVGCSWLNHSILNLFIETEQKDLNK